ncbi:MAG: hypothetical protein ACR2PL_09005 [Dehalococcoidia bacterium]
MNTETAVEAELVAQWIEPDPHKGDPAEARLKASGVSVWAVIGQLELDEWDVASVAEYYEVPKAAVEAAVAYSHRHEEAIKVRLLRHHAFFAV